MLVLGNIPSQGNGQVEPQSQLGTLAIGERSSRLDKIHLFFGIAAGLGQQHIDELERRSFDRKVPKPLKASANRVDHALESDLLRRRKLKYALGSSRLNRHRRPIARVPQDA